MMNKIQHFPFRLWRLLALALPLAACTSEVTDEALPGGASPITFRTAEVTKAVVDDNNPMTEFSVWGWYGDVATNVSTNVFDNVPVTYNGTAWTYTGGDRYWTFGNTYDFYAVYPTTVNANVVADGTITVSDFDCSQGVDLMTAEETVPPYPEGAQTTPVSFTFRHELARVNVVVQVDPQVTVTNLNATLSGYDCKGTLTRPKGGDASWTETAEATPRTATYNNISASSSQDLFGDLLLIPQPTEGITMTLSMNRNGQPINDLPPIRFDESLPQWSAGQAYRYVLHIQVDAITFSNFTADKWGETHTGGDINIGGDTNQGN